MSKTYMGARIYATLGNNVVEHQLSANITESQCRSEIEPMLESLNNKFGDCGFDIQISRVYTDDRSISEELRLF